MYTILHLGRSIGLEPMTTGLTYQSNSICHQYYYGTFDRVTLSALPTELTPPFEKNTVRTDVRLGFPQSHTGLKPVTSKLEVLHYTT